MASGTILLSPPYKMSYPQGLDGTADGHPFGSPAVSAHSGSPLSEVNDIHEPSNLIPSRHTTLDDDQDMSDADAYGSEENNEDDAMGEIDDDYAEEMQLEQDADTNGHSSSPAPSSKSLKRSQSSRSEVDDDAEYAKQLAEEFGRRRSERARPTRYADSPGDDEEEEIDDVVPRPGRKRQKARKSHSTSSNGASSGQDDDDDLDDGDPIYANARARRRRRKTRGHRRSGGSNTPVTGDIRFSTRRAAKVTNYNEDENDLDADLIEDGEPQWDYVEEDTRLAIDQVLNHRRPDESDTATHGKEAYEYYVKWQDKAHCHAEWEDWTTLSSLKGFRRLENYYKKVVEEEWQMLNDPQVILEDRERWNLDREAKLDAMAEHQKVERVISSRSGLDGTEYYIKWKGLTYGHCTWEAAEYISSSAQNEIDRYLDRSSHTPTTNKREANLKTRSRHTFFRDQPDYIVGGRLREFQITGMNFICNHWCNGDNGMLADEMGLGKTVQTVAALSWLKNARGQEGPFIVVVPLSTIPAWAETFDLWTPDINYVVYNGNEASRKIIREYEMLVNGNPRKTKFNVLLTTYEFVNNDITFLSSIQWQYMAVDEAHRLKNQNSLLYANLLRLDCPAKLLITGTPMQNSIHELSVLINFLMPGRIDIDTSTDIGKEDFDAVRTRLRDEFLRPFCMRRLKEEVTKDLPPRTEKIIRVELADVQLDLYKKIMARNFEALAAENGHKGSLLNVMMELKKVSNHAHLFAPPDDDTYATTVESREHQLQSVVASSGKLMLLNQLLTKLQKDGHRVLIFSQMVRMLDILSDFLTLRGHKHQRLDGTMPDAQRRLAISHFNADESSDYCFLLSTRAGGLGINLMTADTVVLFDSDWNPQADLQAMARAHRIGQKKPVSVYRFVSKDTVEEEVLERARNKRMLEMIIIQRGLASPDEEKEIKRAGKKLNEPMSASEIQEILKKRGQKMFEKTSNQKGLEELNIDDVLDNAELNDTKQAENGIALDGGADFLKNFEYTDVKIDLDWAQIIPKEQLEKVRAEEEERKQQAYLESIIEENRPRKRKATQIEDGTEGRAAKKRARAINAKTAESAADQSDSDGDEKDDEDDSSLDPSRPLSEKEIRNLVRAFERYGAIEEMESEVIREARLSNRNKDIVKTTLREVLDLADTLVDAEQQRLAELEAANGRPITKKDKRSVLFDFKGVKRLNAETLQERPKDMHMLRELVERTGNVANFRIAEATKAANYTCSWGAREDGMLCVGIARHGYGAWAKIRNDEELGLKDKFFLEEHRVANAQERGKTEEKVTKSPGAVHLVRRAQYLFDVLRLKTSQGADVQAKRAMDNHHRNNRKGLSGSGAGRHSTSGGSASPAIGSLRKAPAIDSKHRSDAKITKDHHRRSPAGKRSKMNATPEQLESALHDAASSRGQADTERRIVTLLTPIKETLTKLKRCTKKFISSDEQRLSTLKNCLLGIGNHIKKELSRSTRLTEEPVWEHVAEYWPSNKNNDRRIHGPQIRAQYNRFVSRQGDSATQPAANGTDQPLESKPKAAGTDMVRSISGGIKSADLKSLPSFKRKISDGSDSKDKRLETEMLGRRGDSQPFSSGSSRDSSRDRRYGFDRRPEQRPRLDDGRRDTETPPYDRHRPSLSNDRRSAQPNGRPPHLDRRDGRDEYRPDYRNDRYRSDHRSARRDEERRDTYRPADRYDRRPASRDDRQTYDRPRSRDARKPTLERPALERLASREDRKPGNDRLAAERHPLPKKPDFPTVQQRARPA